MRKILPYYLRAARAFTLVELLVVMVVLGVLIGLLLSGISSVRARSNSATCLFNLRQVASAGILYAEENNGGLPVSSYNRQANGMIEYLKYDINYVGKTVLTCPSLQKKYPTRAHHYRTTSINLVATQGHSKSRKNLRAFPTLSRTIFFLDGLLNPGASSGNVYNYHFGALNEQQFEDRFQFLHGNLCHVVYLDGHAKGLSPEELLDWDTQSILWRGE